MDRVNLIHHMFKSVSMIQTRTQDEDKVVYSIIRLESSNISFFFFYLNNSLESFYKFMDLYIFNNSD